MLLKKGKTVLPPDQREHIQGQREHFSEDSGVTPLGKKTLVNTPHLNVMHMAKFLINSP